MNFVGGHTIGVGHCNFFSNRLYNFTGKGDSDPSLNSKYVTFLKTKCQSLSDNTTTVEMDPGSSLTFDNDYFICLKTTIKSKLKIIYLKFSCTIRSIKIER